jgi:rubrerythrin
MSDKPSYLGLLNAIAVGERRGHEVLSAWCEVCRDPELADVLNRVAIREREHAAAFEKRLCELGYGIRERDNPVFAEALESARSDAADAEKFRRVLGYQASDEPGRDDPLARIFDDRSIDAASGALLGRFICEERDSERQLRDQLQRITDAGRRIDDAGQSGDDDQQLADIAARLDRLAETIEQLKQLRR